MSADDGPAFINKKRRDTWPRCLVVNYLEVQLDHHRDQLPNLIVGPR